MINILGLKFPVTGKVMYTKSSPIVMDYINAMKAGKNEARDIFKNIVLK